MTNYRSLRRAIGNLYESNPRLKFYSLEDSLKRLFPSRNTDTKIYNCDSFPVWDALDVAIDVETTGFNYREDNYLLGVGLTRCDTLETMYINCWDYEADKPRDLEVLKNALIAMDFQGVTWYLHNAKFDAQWIYHTFGFWLSRVHDTYLMAYCLDHRLGLSIGSLSGEYLNRHPESLTDILNCGKDEITSEKLKSIPIETLAYYCGEDTLETALLAKKLKAKLMLSKQFLLYDGERHNVLIAAMMEYYGVLIDLESIGELDNFCEIELEVINEIIDNLLGYHLNPASPQQVSKCLFEDLMLPTECTKKNNSGYSVDIKVLEELKYHHPVCQLIVDYRKIAKLYGKDVKPLPTLVDSNNRIHTNYNTCQVVTGRWSSDKPNLQNIPNPFKSELGKKIRNVFVAPEGWSLLKIDYSQFELRLLAHLSQDEFLIYAYNQDSKADIHTLITKLLFNLDFYDKKNEEHKRLRTLCKRLNFGIIYGMTCHRLATESEADGNPMSLTEAQNVIDLWWAKLPGVSEWMDNTRLGAITRGYVEDLLGRRRYFDFEHPILQGLRGHKLETGDKLEDIEIKWLRSDAAKLRQAGNAPVQGSNASVIRRVMSQIYDSYVRGDYGLSECIPLLQVHDELVFQVRTEHLPYYTEKLTHQMEQCVSLDVPVVCDATIAQSWGGE